MDNQGAKQYQDKSLPIELEDPSFDQNQEILQPEENMHPQEQQLNQSEEQKYFEQVEQNTKKLINLNIEQDPPNNQDEEFIQPVKNPFSSYLVFVKKWKKDNPNSKLNMPYMGELWQKLEPHEKRQFEEQFRRQKEKFELYSASKLIKNPNPNHDPEIQNKYFFPLHRVKAIMKQDNFYMPKTEAVASMAMATEYFGEYFLDQLKKILKVKPEQALETYLNASESIKEQWDFQNVLLINIPWEIRKKNPLNSQTTSPRLSKSIQQNKNSKKKKPIKQQTSNTKQLQKGQMKLTDMFNASNNK